MRVEGRSRARTGRGLVVLLGVLRGDDEACARRLAERVAHLRIFPDDERRMKRSLLEVGGEALVVSQVTLAADGKKGRRPSLAAAADPRSAELLYQGFTGALEALGVRCGTGVFGAEMEVELVNDGPVTLLLEEPPDPRELG